MKIYLNLIALVLFVSLTSCEDVIDVDVQSAPIRLTVEASLDWEKGTLGNQQSIKLSTSTRYFDENRNVAVTDATVKVSNDSTNEEFVFINQNDGTYAAANFNPIVNHSYTLEIVYKDEVYIAKETMTPVVDIDAVTQSTEDGFDDEEIEINVVFTDPVDEENFYLFKFEMEKNLLPYLEDFDDEFTNGNEISFWYEESEDDETDKIEALTPGDVVDIEVFGISEDFKNYIQILIEQNEGGGLFSTIPVALKGNCINTTSTENYAHGYFRLTQVVKQQYTVQ